MTSTIYCIAILLLRSLSVLAQVTITYPANVPPGAPYVQDNFFGISFEMQAVPAIIGNNSESIPNPLISYLSNIKLRMSNPLLMQVAGNSMDASTFVTNQTSTMLAGTINYQNYTPITFGPLLLTTMAALADTVGGGRWNVGLSLRNIAAVPSTVNFALLATQVLGPRLNMFLLGNEPDLYFDAGFRPGQANYTVQDYINDFGNVVGQIHASPTLGSVQVAGPQLCCIWDLQTLLEGGFVAAFGAYLKAITIQHYPQENCPPVAPSFNLTYFTNHANVVTLAQWNIQGATTALAAGFGVSVVEFNSVGCGGLEGVSDTFGAALWTADYALQLASVGFMSAYIHTREPGVSYNLFTPPAAGINPSQPGWTTGPPYHALLAVTEALHSTLAPNGMAVVDLGLASPATAPNTIAGYALYPAPNASIARMPPIRFVLINYANSGQISFQFNQNTTGITPQTGGNITIGNVYVKTLMAANVNAAINITWANQVVSGGGTLMGSVVNASVPNCGTPSGCTINVPGPGLAVVFMDVQASISTAEVASPDSTGGTSSNTAVAGAPTAYLFPSSASGLHGHGSYSYLAILFSLLSLFL